jgi:hypothetical protein
LNLLLGSLKSKGEVVFTLGSPSFQHIQDLMHFQFVIGQLLHLVLALNPLEVELLNPFRKISNRLVLKLNLFLELKTPFSENMTFLPIVAAVNAPFFLESGLGIL